MNRAGSCAASFKVAFLMILTLIAASVLIFVY